MLVRRLYDWVLEWAESPYGAWALFILAFAESSFFPIPPDVLLIVLALSLPARAFRYALICSVGSVMGGIVGYLIGIFLMEGIGCPLVSFYHGEKVFNQIALTFNAHSFWAVFVAAVTPIPYKIFTIAAGALHSDFWSFFWGSAIGRPLRFFAVALLLYHFGPPIKKFIDKYFNWLSVVFMVLLIGGFVAVKHWSHKPDVSVGAIRALVPLRGESPLPTTPFEEICR